MSDLLTFYHNHQLRLKLPDDYNPDEAGAKEAGVVDAEVADSSSSPESEDSAPKSTAYTFISGNLQRCYDNYLSLMEAGEGKPDQLFAEFQQNGIEVWQSGLVCGMNPECKLELAYFIEKKHTGNGVGKKINSMFALPSGTTCPPNCGCDNPWPFMP